MFSTSRTIDCLWLFGIEHLKHCYLTGGSGIPRGWLLEELKKGFSLSQWKIPSPLACPECELLEVEPLDPHYYRAFPRSKSPPRRDITGASRWPRRAPLPCRNIETHFALFNTFNPNPTVKHNLVPLKLISFTTLVP